MTASLTGPCRTRATCGPQCSNAKCPLQETTFSTDGVTNDRCANFTASISEPAGSLQCGDTKTLRIQARASHASPENDWARNVLRSIEFAFDLINEICRARGDEPLQGEKTTLQKTVMESSPRYSLFELASIAPW